MSFGCQHAARGGEAHARPVRKLPKLGQDEQLAALQKLDEESRKLERAAKGATFEDLLAEERAQSHQYGGRSVFGWEPPVEPAADCPLA